MREFPPGTVMHLNELYHGGAGSPAWPEELENAWLWLEVHGAYAAWEHEQAWLENLELLLEEVESARDLCRLRPALEGAHGLMQHVLSERRRLGLAQDECLNDLLLAGAAMLRGGDRRAVLERLPLAHDRVACLRGWLDVYDEQLVPAFRLEVEQGLDCLESCLAELAHAPVSEELLSRATRAALVADVFQEWEVDWRRQTEQAFCKYGIPRVGADLEDIVARGWQLDRSQWSLGIWRLRKVLFPALSAHWQSERESALLTVSAEEALLPVDLGLEQLWEALTGLTDPTRTAEEVLTRLEQALLELSTAFQRFEHSRLRRDHLSPTLGSYYELAQGILGGRIPDLYLAELLVEETLGPEFAAAERCLREYLAARDPELLNQALGEIARQARALAQKNESRAADLPGFDQELRRWRAASCL